MRSTRTLLGSKARRAIFDGVNSIYLPTSKTFGPEGRNALLYRTFNRGSRITNDGVTVADVQEPKDPFVKLASTAFKEACKRTNERVGDGTTATAILGGVLFNHCYNKITEGQSQFTKNGGGIGVMTLKKTILSSAEAVKQRIKESAKKIETLEELEKIAIVSVEDVELGKIIAKMAWEVGIDGFIDVVEGYKGEIETEIIKGMRFPAKVPAKAFVNNPLRYEMVATDCPVFLTNYALDNASEVATVFQRLNAATSKIIILAPSFSENVLVNMVNATKSGYFFYPVKIPSLREDQCEDLAVYTGATFFNKNKGKSFRNAQASDLGFLAKLVVKDTEAKEDAVATGGKGEQEEIVIDVETQEIDGKKHKVSKERQTSKIAERITVLKGQIEETRQENFKKLLERRIASIASSVGIIRVGDSTQASSLYRKLKIEDAVYACKAALRGGYVKGAGLCLKEIAETLPDDDILKTTLLAPYDQIQSSVDGGVTITDDIIDPMEAIYYALEHASQVVANLITVEIITEEIPDPVYGEGELELARAFREFVLNDKIAKGQLQENEREMERDRMESWMSKENLSTDELVELSGHDY